MLVDQDPLPLITEAMRGAGAVLINQMDERFMVPVHPLAELAPRDVVARGVWAELSKGNKVFIDPRQAVGSAFPGKFPNIAQTCAEWGIDPIKQPIPVVPACHYHMGGIDVSLNGRSTVSGLWACGEVSSTGVHGANRLASNSLLEAVVFGNRVVADILSLERGSQAESVFAPYPMASMRAMIQPETPAEETAAMRRIMWDSVGLVRDADGLQNAAQEFAMFLRTSEDVNYAVANRALVCRLVAESALARHESRGAHYRTDFPEENPEYKRHSTAQWDQASRSCFVGFEGGTPVGVRA